jgi:hypothetical protein
MNGTTKIYQASLGPTISAASLAGRGRFHRLRAPKEGQEASARGFQEKNNRLSSGPESAPSTEDLCAAGFASEHKEPSDVGDCDESAWRSHCAGRGLDSGNRVHSMKHDPYRAALLASCLLVSFGAASAATFSGNFGDRGNTALVSSDLGTASFTDPYAIANNVALYNFVVATTATVDIQSTAFVSGGADPYFSLFQGSGGSATFLASNYDQAFSTGGDFDYSSSLTAGHYEIALGVSANQSFAENYGSGTLADGFIGLGDPGSLGNGSYSVQVTMKSGQPVAAPEIDAASLVTALTLLAGSILAIRGRQRSPATCR